MKIIRRANIPEEPRPNGRVVQKLYEQEQGGADCAIYLSKLAGGLDFHLHKQSVEMIFFPEGGRIEVNGELLEMGAWDMVVLEPNDVHGLRSENGAPQLHLAIKFPGGADKVSLSGSAAMR